MKTVTEQGILAAAKLSRSSLYFVHQSWAFSARRWTRDLHPRRVAAYPRRNRGGIIVGARELYSFVAPKICLRDLEATLAAISCARSLRSRRVPLVFRIPASKLRPLRALLGTFPAQPLPLVARTRASSHTLFCLWQGKCRYLPPTKAPTKEGNNGVGGDQRLRAVLGKSA